jgi:glutamine synthetase
VLLKNLSLLKKLDVEVFLGIELEFYSTLPNSHFQFKDIIIKDELGLNQKEAVFLHSNNVLQVLKDVICFRNKFKKEANFNAFISSNLPPSSMQFNVSIKSKNYNLLNENILHFLLEETKKNLSFFIPTQNCKKRIQDLNLINKFRNSPYTFSIGDKNNRTVMIRLVNDYFEHRLPSPCCNILKSFNVILNAIILGLKSNKNYKIQIVHSNAFEKSVIEDLNLNTIFK